MSKVGKLIFVAVMVMLVLVLGSCAKASPVAATGVPVVREASIADLFSTDDSGHDSTAFLVGEFNCGNGTMARFNGFGEITLVSAAGEAASGSYTMTEYESKKAVVNISLGGVTTDYTFALDSSDGDFTLTDEHGNIYAFSPVKY